MQWECTWCLFISMSGHETRTWRTHTDMWSTCGIKLRILELWSDSATRCTTVPPLARLRGGKKEKPLMEIENTALIIISEHLCSTRQKDHSRMSDGTASLIKRITFFGENTNRKGVEQVSSWQLRHILLPLTACSEQLESDNMQKSNLLWHCSFFLSFFFQNREKYIFFFFYLTCTFSCNACFHFHLWFLHIHPPTHLFIHSSIHPFIPPFIHLSYIYPSIYHSSIHPLINFIILFLIHTMFYF